jgi:adenosylcobyric acid synthase
MLRFADGRVDGAASADGRIAGCYVHGLFADEEQRSYWMRRIGSGRSTVDYDGIVDATLDELARHLEQHVDCDALLAAARVPRIR